MESLRLDDTGGGEGCIMMICAVPLFLIWSIVLSPIFGFGWSVVGFFVSFFFLIILIGLAT